MSNYFGQSYKIILLLFLLAGCKGNESKTSYVPVSVEDESASDLTSVRQIFYKMYLPTEMSRLFEKTGTNFDPAILNSAENFSRYSTPDKIALNLGIYGVDMSYTRIFNQTSATAKYFTTIQLMAEKLGIPDNYYQDIYESFEKYHDDKDTIAKLAGNIYERLHKFFQENEKESYVAIVMTGGWIEAVYLACKISEANPGNIEIVERIAEQKYSLNSIISLLSNYQDDIRITEIILMLKQLKNSYDKIEIYYNRDNFKLDTINNLITASGHTVEITPEIVSEIRGLISEIRMSIVN